MDGNTACQFSKMAALLDFQVAGRMDFIGILTGISVPNLHDFSLIHPTVCDAILNDRDRLLHSDMTCGKYWQLLDRR